MNRLAFLARRLLGLAAVVALGATLSGCLITSDTNLIADSEIVTPLPATFQFASYDEKDSGYALSEDVPQGFTLDGNGYVSEDKTVTAHFAPLEDGSYLLAINSPDGLLYGFATYTDNVLELSVILAEKDVTLKSGVADIPGVEMTEDGVKVTGRAALDQVVALHQSGKLQMSPMIAYITPAGETAPKTLTRSGDGWIKG